MKKIYFAIFLVVSLAGCNEEKVTARSHGYSRVTLPL